MVKQTSTEYDRPGLAREFEKAFYSTVQKSTNFERPEVLTALVRLLIKPKRISHVIKKKPDTVRDMIRGKQKCPVALWPALYGLLRLSVDVAKDHIKQAEEKTLLWGTEPFPAEVLTFFRARIAEAEQVLARAEETITKAAQK